MTKVSRVIFVTACLIFLATPQQNCPQQTCSDSELFFVSAGSFSLGALSMCCAGFFCARALCCNFINKQKNKAKVLKYIGKLMNCFTHEKKDTLGALTKWFLKGSPEGSGLVAIASGICGVALIATGGHFAFSAGKKSESKDKRLATCTKEGA